MDLGTIISTLTSWIVGIGGTVNDLPGVVAFAMGLFTWFLVEQILRRIMSGLRWIIVIGALAGLGLTVPYVASLIFQRGGTPELGVATE